MKMKKGQKTILLFLSAAFFLATVTKQEESATQVYSFGPVLLQVYDSKGVITEYPEGAGDVWITPSETAGECELELIIKQNLHFWVDGYFIKAVTVPCDPNILLQNFAVKAYRFEKQDIAIEGQDEIDIQLNLNFNYETSLLNVQFEREWTVEIKKSEKNEFEQWVTIIGLVREAKDSDQVAYYLLLAYIVQAVIFIIMMFTKVPRAQIASKTLFISFFCLLDCTNFAARMNREPKKTVFYIPFLFFGCVTAFMPLKAKYFLSGDRHSRVRRIKNLKISLSGPVMQQDSELYQAEQVKVKTQTNSNKKKLRKVKSIKKQKPKSDVKKSFYFPITYYGKKNLFVFLILLGINATCQYIRPSWMTYSSHGSVYFVFLWEIIDQKIELPHAFLTLGAVFCYTGLQLIMRGISLPLVDLPLTDDIVYMVMEGSFLFIIFCSIFTIDVKTRKRRLKWIAEKKKLPRLPPSVDNVDDIVGGRNDKEDWDAGGSQNGADYAQI